jgi:hypothetical protein
VIAISNSMNTVFTETSGERADASFPFWRDERRLVPKLFGKAVRQCHDGSALEKFGTTQRSSLQCDHWRHS